MYMAYMYISSLLSIYQTVLIHIIYIHSSFHLHLPTLLSLPSLFPTRFNYAPDLHVPMKTYDRPGVGGKNRYKYFRRPIIPFLPQMPPNVVLAPTRSVCAESLMYVHVHDVCAFEWQCMFSHSLGS